MTNPKLHIQVLMDTKQAIKQLSTLKKQVTSSLSAANKVTGTTRAVSQERAMLKARLTAQKNVSAGEKASLNILQEKLNQQMKFDAIAQKGIIDRLRLEGKKITNGESASKKAVQVAQKNVLAGEEASLKIIQEKTNQQMKFDAIAQKGIIDRLRLESKKTARQNLGSKTQTIEQMGLGYDENADIKNKVQQYQQLQNSVKQLGQIQKEVGKDSDVYKNQAKQVENLRKQLKLTTGQIKSMGRHQKRMNFDFLTLLFAGMMLKRVFGGALRNIIDSYKKMTGLNSEFNRSTMKLGASWTYLKFSIANALNNPMIINMIEWLSDALEWISDWAQDNPDLVLTLLGIAGGLAALGVAGMALSGWVQMGMFGAALAKLITDAGGLGTLSASLKGIASAFGWIILAIIILYLAWKYNFGKIRDITYDTFELIKTGAKGLYSALKITFSGIGLLIKGAMTGSADDFTDGLKKIGTGAIVFAGNLVHIVIGLISNLTKLAVNAMWDAVMNSTQLLGGIAVKLFNLIGIDTTEAESSLEALKTKSDEWQTAMNENSFDKLNEVLNSNMNKITTWGEHYDAEINKVVEARKKLEEPVKEVNPFISPVNPFLPQQGMSQASPSDLAGGMTQQLGFSTQEDYFGKATEQADAFKTSLVGEEGLSNALFNVDTALSSESGLNAQITSFTTQILTGNDVLPSHISHLNSESTAMNKLAAATNKAAIAQERLNKAKKNKSKSSSSSGSSSSASTSTRS